VLNFEKDLPRKGRSFYEPQTLFNMTSLIRFKLKNGMDYNGKKNTVLQNGHGILKQSNLQKLFFSGKITIEEYQTRKKTSETIQ
jgi:hypothetical protein